MIFQSPAKINLILKVLSKREDGYHEIFSVMQAISLFDSLLIEKASFDEFTSSDPSLAMDQKNLVVQAVELFREKTSIKTPLKIHLEKRIPQGAGLGGGSSNAATCLWALDHLFSTQLDLKSLGASLGSDVPFFFSLGIAACYGRGEIIHPLKPLKPSKCFLYFPHLFCSTKAVYQAFKNSLNHHQPEDILRNFLEGHQEYFNDLQPCALKVENALVKHLDSLLSCGISNFLLTGSGSTIVIYQDVDQKLIEHLKLKEVKFITRQHQQWY
jgi:4-diphosphocytidyl-2-C-methyl-D-erythritol kinase